MLILALDTSTPAVSVAVCRDGVAVATETVVDARRHGELLAVGIDAVLVRAAVMPRQLNAVAAGVGPGPYTGLRIGLMTARALGHALGIPVHGVCSLDILARAAAREIASEFMVATDARRKEVYWARYLGHERLEGPSVDLPAEVAYPGPVVGQGPVLYPEAFPAGRAPIHPDPVDLAAIVEAAVAAGTETLPPDPLYLRRPDAVEPAARELITVTDRGRPVAVLGPPPGTVDLSAAALEGWVTLPTASGLVSFRPRPGSTSVLAALAEDRDE